jgi:O-antigen/teichoic acid export membrane protein
MASASNSQLFKHIKNPVVKSLGMYTVTSFLAKGVAFLLLPFFTHVLSKSDMGTLSLFSSAIIFLVPFISMGVLQSINADFFKLDKAAFRTAFTTSLILPVCVFLLALLFFHIFREPLHQRFQMPLSFAWIIPLVAFMSFLFEHFISTIRNNNLTGRFMTVVLGRLFIEVLLAVILLLVLKWGWEGRVAGIIISNIIIAIAAFYFFIQKGYLFGKVSKKIIREELIYSVPIIIMQLSVFCMNSSDSFFLAHFTGSKDNNAEVGVYSIACIFASIILTLCSALLQYITPKIYSLLSAPQINYQSIRKNSLLYIGVLTGGWLLLLLFIPLAYKIFIPKSYFGGLKYYYLLCTGYYFWTIAYFFYSIALLYNKKKKLILLLSLSSIVISLTNNYFFIKYYGSMGAAIADCCSYFIILLVTLFFTRKQMGFLFTKKYAQVA